MEVDVLHYSAPAIQQTGAETGEGKSKQIEAKDVAALKATVDTQKSGDKKENADKDKPLVAMPSEATLVKAVDDANKVLSEAARKLDIRIHEKTKQIMVKVINTSNDEVIREIPSKESLDFLASVLEQAGILVDKKS